MADIVQRFETVHAMLSQIKASGYVKGTGSFYGRPTREAIAYVRQGASESEQESVREIMDRVDASVERERRVSIASPVGSHVVVPDFLQGAPYPMRRRKHVANEAAPVRIVIETLASQGCSLRSIRARGAACAALALALAETRPVELWAAWGMQPHTDYNRTDVIGMVKLDTPMSISEVTAVLTSPEFTRSITFANCYSASGMRPSSDIHWAWESKPTETQRNERMRRALNLDANDVFLPGGHVTQQDMMVSDPVAWVNKYLDAPR